VKYFPFFRFALGLLFLADGFATRAQVQAPGGLPPGLDHALLAVLADGPPFHGRALVVCSNTPNQTATYSCDIASLEGNLRIEASSTDSGANLSPLEVVRRQQMHSVILLRPGRNRAYLIFPNIRTYVEVAYSKASTNAVPPPKLEKTVPEKETVNDLPCEKSHWTVTEFDGQKFDATIWSSANWNGLPVQIRVAAPMAEIVFQDLHLDPPAGQLFEPPGDYVKYDGVEQMIRQKLEKPANAPTQ
jgi:hypothetical protein